MAYGSPYQLITPHAQRERGKVIGVGVLIYKYVCGPKKFLNRTLAIATGTTTAFSRNAFLIE